MNASYGVFLKAFLQDSKELSSLLTQQERSSLEQTPLLTGPIRSWGIDELLDQVHWSWHIPTLKKYSPAEQKLFLPVLSRYAARNLAKTLLLRSEPHPLEEVGRAYLQSVLVESLEPPALPIDALPPSSMNGLLKYSKKELTDIIDRLAMHDLALEMKQIVETKILQKIYSLLSEEERHLLKAAAAHKDPFTTPKMGLDRWDGSEETFRTVIHRRGLSRLGAALSGQASDLIWYVSRKLDIGRGSALHKHCLKEPIPKITDIVMTQVETLL